MKPLLLVLSAAAFLLLGSGRAAAGDDPARVLVIYNAAFPDRNGNGVGDSKEVALYYKARRGIPDRNILPVFCTQDFQYEYEAGWTSFFNEIVEPLRARLLLLGEEEIDIFVTCHGVPVKFIKGGLFAERAIDNILAYPWNLGTASQYYLPKRFWNNPYLEESPTVLPDNGRFDHTYKLKEFNIYLVTRLDGPSAARALDLVDRALYGEKYLWPDPGYFSGALYIDTQYKAYTDPELQGYPFDYLTYDSCDRSIAYAKFFADASGYDWLWENTSTELEIGDPGATYHDGTPADLAPDALLYAGWYNINKYNDVWEWIPGSAACDLNSLSILGIREEAPPSFLANAFLRGLTCGTGVIYEPLTTGHQRPEVFFHAMLNGFNFAEASGLSLPAICFSNMSVGDALYNPHRSGKVPALDTTPPPVPDVAVSAEPGIDTERTLIVSIDTLGRDPDVAVSEADYGLTPAYGNTLPYGTVFRRQHELFIDGLIPSTFYHFKARVKDPAGLTAETGDFIFFTERPDPLIVDAFPDTQTVPQGAGFDLGFHLSSEGGVKKVTDFGVTLTALHLGIVERDIAAFLVSLPHTLEHDPEHTTRLYRFSLPGTGIPGTYEFKAKAVHNGVTQAEDACFVDVQ